MKFSLALVVTIAASGFAMTSSAVTAVAEDDDMILTAHEGLFVMDNHLAREINAEEESVIDSCLMSVFNELHDPAVAHIQDVEGDPDSPINAVSSVIEGKNEVGDFPPFQTYSSIRWRRFYTTICRMCLPDCDSDYRPLPGSNTWLCAHLEEAKVLSPQERFKATESSRHIEWETGTCDCLARTGLVAFDGVSNCMLAFSPVNDEIPVETAAGGVAAETLSLEPLKDDELESDTDDGDFIHQSHESVVLFNTQTNRDLNDEENYFLDQCLIDTFNALHEDTGSKIEEVATEIEKFVTTGSFISDTLSTIQNHLEWNTFPTYSSIRWRRYYTTICRMCLPDCDSDYRPLPGAKTWLCDHPEEAKLLSGEKRAKLTMAWKHDMWQRDLCSCLISGEMEGFEGIQNCQITFPPVAEQSLRGSASKAE
jgi:hypothetical protein